MVSLAPSFVAAFSVRSRRTDSGGFEKLGFQEVRETAEGAEWVAREHARLLDEGKKKYCSSSCPAINALIYKYYPQYVSLPCSSCLSYGCSCSFNPSGV